LHQSTGQRLAVQDRRGVNGLRLRVHHDCHG
jgi:hypothetical protein